MQDTRGMRSSQSTGGLLAIIDRQCGIYLCRANQLPEGRAIHPFHCDKKPSGGVSGFADLLDVGMTQCRCCAGLCLVTSDCLCSENEMPAENLHRYQICF